MKHSIPCIFAFAVASAFPIGASADTTGGVCGRVDAGTSQIATLLADPLQSGIVIARSATEEVQTNIGNGGTYCFKSLHTDLHTIVAFGEGATYSATVTPVDGKTLSLDLTTKN